MSRLRWLWTWGSLAVITPCAGVVLYCVLVSVGLDVWSWTVVAVIALTGLASFSLGFHGGMLARALKGALGGRWSQ